jgi:cyclopropane-fatty-acyl-phospholipid synthase
METHDKSRSARVSDGISAPHLPDCVDEDRDRTNFHYDLPAEFFVKILGGGWHSYSCNLWDQAADETASQEAKFDLFAKLLGIRAGHRVLDVGSGWGGHLSYLAKAYGVTGVGLTLSPRQRQFAELRARNMSVDVDFRECHWSDFHDSEGFDAVYTDEAVVHFRDLESYFHKVSSLLRPGGRMLNKEIHFASSRWMQQTPTIAFLNQIFGGTGNYRTLHEELELMDNCGFSVVHHEQLAMSNGVRTLDAWLRNMDQSRSDLLGIVGADYYQKFRKYLRLTRRIMRSSTMTLDVVVSHRDVDHGRHVN